MVASVSPSTPARIATKICGLDYADDTRLITPHLPSVWRSCCEAKASPFQILPSRTGSRLQVIRAGWRFLRKGPRYFSMALTTPPLLERSETIYKNLRHDR